MIRIIILFLTFYVLFGQQSNISYAQQETKVDIRVEKLKAFFKSFNSPFEKLSKDFVKSSDLYGLDYRLFAVVSCVESSCGKRYLYNAFGWGSDSIDYGNDTEDLYRISNRISTLSHYKTYRKTKDLRDFALAYNGSYSQSYYEKLKYFWRKIQ